MRQVSAIIALGLASLAFQAQSAVITNPAQVPGTHQVIDFNNEDGLFIGAGSGYTVGTPSVTFSSLDGDFTVGQRIATDLGINGSWGAGKSFLSFDTIGEMTLRIDFGNLRTRAFTADFSLYEQAGVHSLLTVTAYGVDGSSSSFTLGGFSTSLGGVDLDDNALIDSTNYAITQGLRLAHADIAYITIKGDGVVLDNFTLTTPVPEPQTYALMLAGMGVLAFVARRRQQA